MHNLQKRLDGFGTFSGYDLHLIKTSSNVFIYLIKHQEKFGRSVCLRFGSMFLNRINAYNIFSRQRKRFNTCFQPRPQRIFSLEEESEKEVKIALGTRLHMFLLLTRITYQQCIIIITSLKIYELHKLAKRRPFALLHLLLTHQLPETLARKAFKSS